MSNSKSDSAVALTTDKGTTTPLAVNPYAISDEMAEGIRSTIQTAAKADKTAFVDITPLYWEAKRGDIKTMAFLGWKQVLKVDEKSGEEEQRYMCVFHDGDRQIVAGQLALMDAMFGRPTGKVYRIECVESVAGKAKKFTVEQFNG